MAQILVRNLSDQTVERLKARAKRNQRSLEAEVRGILDDSTAREPDGDASRAAHPDWRAEIAQKLRDELKGRPQSDSVELLREDRDTR